MNNTFSPNAASASSVQANGFRVEVSLVRGGHHLAVIPDKLAVKTGEPQKMLKLLPPLLAPWPGPEKAGLAQL